MSKPTLMKRFSWNSIRAALNDIERCQSYYVGATLCIDMTQGYTVTLCRNGRGSAFIVGNQSNTKFLMPFDCQEKVNELYRKYKKSSS